MSVRPHEPHTPKLAANHPGTAGSGSSSRPVWLLIDASGVGGAERHVATLAQSLRRYGLPAEVVLYEDHGNMPWRAQLACAEVPVRMLDGTVAGLYHAVKSVRPLLVHTHGYKAGILGRPAARRVGVPVVSTFHTGGRERWPVGLYDLLDEWTSFLGKRIAVSPAIQKRLPFSSYHITSYVSVPFLPPQGPLPRRVGFVGRLCEEKQPDQFCALARRSPSGVEWHVYGDGPMRARLEREHADIVRFHGAVSDMGPVWRSLGLLVITSRFEGLPLAALEALAAGVPVLSSRIGGVPSIVQDGVTGWLFEPEDLDGAERGLRSWLALDAASQNRLREAAWRHVGKNFSEATVLPRVIAVYQSAGAELSTFERRETEPRSPGPASHAGTRSICPTRRSREGRTPSHVLTEQPPRKDTQQCAVIIGRPGSWQLSCSSASSPRPGAQLCRLRASQTGTSTCE